MKQNRIQSHIPCSIPHFDGDSGYFHITYRLADSLPALVLQRLIEDCENNKGHADPKTALRERIESWLDAGHGSCILTAPPVAELICDAWRHFEGDRYSLHAFVVMPNHCHVLIQRLDDCPIAKIVLSWKSFTARRINQWRESEGMQPMHPVWMRDYWDRYIRNLEHYNRVIEYIHQNPVKAGLVSSAVDWKWSSASGLDAQ
jgi:putative transposase